MKYVTTPSANQTCQSLRDNCPVFVLCLFCDVNMPVIFVERLPLPSLRAYTTVSVLLLAGSIYYALQVTSEPGWNKGGNLSTEGGLSQPQDTSTIGKYILGTSRTVVHQEVVNGIAGNQTRPSFTNQMADLVTFMIQEPHCIWVSIQNRPYCSHR